MTDGYVPPPPRNGRAMARVGLVVSWIWAAFSVFAFTALLFQPDEDLLMVVSAVAMLFSALAVLPPLHALLRQGNIFVPPALRAFLAFVFLIVSIASTPDDPDEPTHVARTQNGPTSQPEPARAPAKSGGRGALAAFARINAQAKSAYAAEEDSDKQTEIYKARNDRVAALLPNGNFAGWPGTVMKIRTDHPGYAFLYVRLDGCDCELRTNNNRFSEFLGSLEGDQATVIGDDTPLYGKVNALREGNRVLVSGKIVHTLGVTESMEVENAQWLTRFSDVSRQSSP